jgi:hypothetical protein
MCRQRAGLVFVVIFSKRPAGHGKGLRGPRVEDPCSKAYYSWILLRHERDWILYGVINERCSNRGIWCYYGQWGINWYHSMSDAIYEVAHERCRSNRVRLYLPSLHTLIDLRATKQCSWSFKCCGVWHRVFGRIILDFLKDRSNFRLK